MVMKLCLLKVVMGEDWNILTVIFSIFIQVKLLVFYFPLIDIEIFYPLLCKSIEGKLIFFLSKV